MLVIGNLSWKLRIVVRFISSYLRHVKNDYRLLGKHSFWKTEIESCCPVSLWTRQLTHPAVIGT